MTRPIALLAAAAVACVLVPATASASASDDVHVTWDQVRGALDAARRPGQPAHPGPPARPAPPAHPAPPGHPAPTPTPTAPAAPGAVTITVTIPDLSWALDDPTASAGVRRAACHQVTGLDDETAAPLAACLAHVRATPWGHWRPR